jgi:phage terminase Nu1 subunit (DNA packaging protein)
MATQKDLADHLFISPQAVGNLVKNGIITVHKGRSPIDIDFARREYLEHLRKTQNHYKKSGVSGDIVEESTRLKKFQADKAELEVNQLEGKLIPASLVRDTWSGLVANAHAKFLNIPTNLAHQVLAAEDFSQAADLIKNSIHEALEELSGDGIPTEYAERTQTGTKAVATTNRTKDI